MTNTIQDIETVIIGGGMAGLACAKSLHEAKKPFVLISDRLGGSVVTSADGATNYGAYYVTEDYTHVNQFVTRGRRISQSQITFHTKQSSYTSFGRKVFGHYEQFARYKTVLNRIRPQVIAFRKTAETMDQVEALKQYPELYELYNMSAKEFIEANDFREFVDDYIGQIIYATAFVRADDIEAFDLLWLSFPVILNTYEFVFHEEAMSAPFARSIVYDMVSSIDRSNPDEYIVHTEKGVTFKAKNVVVATPTDVAQKLLQLPKVNPPTSVYMLHVQGTLKPGWEKRTYNFFSNDSLIRVIAEQADGTYLIYAHNSQPALEDYFLTYDVISTKNWDPAFNLAGNILLPVIQGSNLYLVGGHNICSLEDAFITGLFAANSIISS